MSCSHDLLPLLGCLLLACATEVHDTGSQVSNSSSAGSAGLAAAGAAAAGSAGSLAAAGNGGLAGAAGTSSAAAGTSGAAGSTSASGGTASSSGGNAAAGTAGSVAGGGSGGSGGSPPTGVVGDVVVSYQPVKKNANEWAEAMIYVDNEGSDVSLDDVELRYYFDSEYDPSLAGNWTVSFSVAYLGGSAIQGDVLGQVVQMAEPATSADSYVEITFQGGHTLSADRLSITFWLAPPNYDVAQNQANDFSFDPVHTGTPWALVPLRQGDTLIWGADP